VKTRIRHAFQPTEAHSVHKAKDFVFEMWVPWPSGNNLRMENNINARVRIRLSTKHFLLSLSSKQSIGDYVEAVRLSSTLSFSSTLSIGGCKT
jgi:hypothetical protein